MSASLTSHKTWNRSYNLCGQLKKIVGVDIQAPTRWRRAEVGTLITFGTKWETKSKMKRIVDASVVKTADEADRDKALCVSSIAANVQYQSVSQSVCLCLFSSSPPLGLALALNWGQMSPPSVCLCLHSHECRPKIAIWTTMCYTIVCGSHIRGSRLTQTSPAHHALRGDTWPL